MFVILTYRYKAHMSITDIYIATQTPGSVDVCITHVYRSMHVCINSYNIQMQTHTYICIHLHIQIAFMHIQNLHTYVRTAV
jgi:hypothetical protein